MLEPFRRGSLRAAARLAIATQLQRSHGLSRQRKLRVAIIGSGNIGTDLMFKVERSPLLELAGVAGIDPASDGLRLAREHGHPVSDTGLAGLLDLRRAHRPGVRRDVGAARTPSMHGCWPSAASAAST